MSSKNVSELRARLRGRRCALRRPVTSLSASTASFTLVSVTGINRAKDVRRSLRLIASQVRPDPELLKDESQDLRTLRTPIAAG